MLPSSEPLQSEPRAKPFSGTAASRATRDDWRPLFAAFPTIALVANSEEVDTAALRKELPDDTLFVFFNKVYKVLDGAFDGLSLLAVRSGTGGPNILSRGEVGRVTGYFPEDRFLGILCMRTAAIEKVTPASAFSGVPTGQLDLAEYFVDFYPPDHLPSSGFALAVWLAELELGRPIVLAGFSAKRSERWKIFDVHDWTFEQIVQRLLVRAGRLTLAKAPPPHAYAQVLARFPEFSAETLSLAASEILSERLEGANAEIGKLIATTSVNRSVERLVRGLKPIEGLVRRFKRRNRR